MASNSRASDTLVKTLEKALKASALPGEIEGMGKKELADAAKTRGALLDILGERVLDVSSFTRSAVLKAWIQVVQSRSLPVERFIPVTLLAIDRLQDKTIMARRQAMQVRK